MSMVKKAVSPLVGHHPSPPPGTPPAQAASYPPRPESITQCITSGLSRPLDNRGDSSAYNNI